jgi:hypothetical protein
MNNYSSYLIITITKGGRDNYYPSPKEILPPFHGTKNKTIERESEESQVTK